MDPRMFEGVGKILVTLVVFVAVAACGIGFAAGWFVTKPAKPLPFGCSVAQTTPSGECP